MNVIEEIKNDVSGAAILRDWLGDGEPVSQGQAESRALVCLHGYKGSECPKHKAARWWEFYKTPIANAIKDQIAVKSKMKLETLYDADLKMCSACGCAMPVKVWVPIKHIKAHATPEGTAKLTPFCWQRTEMEAV